MLLRFWSPCKLELKLNNPLLLVFLYLKILNLYKQRFLCQLKFRLIVCNKASLLILLLRLISPISPNSWHLQRINSFSWRFVYPWKLRLRPFKSRRAFISLLKTDNPRSLSSRQLKELSRSLNKGNFTRRKSDSDFVEKRFFGDFCCDSLSRYWWHFDI